MLSTGAGHIGLCREQGLSIMENQNGKECGK